MALLLAEMAGDSRRTPAERRQAEEALAAMTPTNLLEVGLAADFGEVSMRFLREFDKADRDPARTAAELNSFAYTLEKLFVEGYVLVPASQTGLAAAPATGPAASRGSGEAPSAGGSDPAASRGSGESAAAPSAGSIGPSPAAAAPCAEAKTLTQIVCEQLENIVEVRYGSKVHVLWNGGSKNYCEESMQQIGQVVVDCLRRLRVDFDDQDLYMALEAMDTRAWAGATGQKSLLLRSKARRLCEAVGLGFSWDTWRTAIRFVERERRRRADAHTVDNRVVWDAALTASEGQDPSPLDGFGPLVAFYVCVTDGTGNVERFLGTHASFLAHHAGGPDTEMSEVCLEIAREGPKTEDEMFTRDIQKPNVLLLTDFSRRCAELWRCLHGRRFACYKQRRDKGKRNTGLRLRGSMKAVGIMQQQATRVLEKMAREDEEAVAASQGEATPRRPTVVGVERKALMHRVRECEVPAPSKSLLDFRKTTAERKAMKDKVCTWPGFGLQAPPLRAKQGG